MAEITMKEVKEAFDEFQKSLDSKYVDHAKIERLNGVFDKYEEKNQALVAAQQQILSHETSIKKLREEFEAKGMEAVKLREQLDQIEIAFAKQTTKADVNWRDRPETKSYENYIRTGEIDIKTLRTDTATEGGVLVTDEMENMIVKRITEIDPIRTIARVRPIASKSLNIPTRTSIPVATYEGEGAQNSNSQSAYGSETLTAYRLTHNIPITRDMLMDASFDMEREILNDSAEAFAYGEGNNFVAGTGFKQPYGFINDPDVLASFVASTSGTAGTLLPEDLFKLQGQLKQGYNGTFVLNRRTLAAIRSLRAGSGFAAADGAGSFMWQPSFTNGGMATLAGDPYVLSNSMPDIASNAYPIAYGDFRAGYLIVDRTAVEVIRDDFTQKRLAIVEFTIHRWNTGKVILAEAIKLLKLDA